MKHYRNLNGCVSKMHRVIYDAYDKGYQQAKKDYGRQRAEWEPVPVPRLNNKGYLSFECSACKTLAIAKYLFCPYCGSPMTEESYGETES